MSSTGPGFVSKILWHFTGGPVWNPKRNEQGKILKPPADAYKKLTSILESRCLKVGRFREVVNVTLPIYREYSASKKKVVEVKNKRITMQSSPVCCLADIPAVHLGYHARRYGQFAIGFHRSSAVGHGFNPVLYTLPTTEVIQHIHEGLSSIESIDSGDLIAAAESIEVDASYETDDPPEIDTSEVVGEAEVLEGYAREAQSSIQDFIAFIKTFEPNQFDSIYCEREWRSVKDFVFRMDDVAMVVLPRVAGGRHYFDSLLKETKRLRIDRKVPIVPWEDFVEH